jgi:hypothetical protein
MDSLDKSRRRTKFETNNERNYECGCGKSYLSYPALYLHLKIKHDGKHAEGTQCKKKVHQILFLILLFITPYFFNY